MDGNLSNVPGTLKESAGLALFGLSALDALRSPGGLAHLLQTRALLTQDPKTRAALQDSPFLSGALGFPGSFTARSGAGEPERAGLSPEQAAQMGVQVVGPSPTFGGAPPPSGSRFVPSMGALSPEGQLEQQITAASAQLMGQSGAAEQAARHQLGLQPPGLTPSQVAGYRGALEPGETLNVPLGGGARMGLRGRFGAESEAPYGYTRDPANPTRLVRDIRVPAAKAGGVSGEINTEFKLWRATHPKGTYDDYIRDKARGSEMQKMSGPATVQIEQELQQVRTLDELTKDMLSALDKPEVQSQLGVLSGRIGFAKYKAGLAQNPLENEFITLRELVRVLAVGRLARAAGSRSAVIWQDLNIHPPQAGDQPQLIRDKLIQLRRALHDTAKNAATVARTPRSRLGTLVPEEGVPAPGGSPYQPGQEIIPGVRYEGPGGAQQP